MKGTIPVKSITAVTLFLSLCSSMAQVELNRGAAEIIDRGPNHRIWRHAVTEVLRNGKTTQRVGSVVELATGLHYWDGNRWAETLERFDLFKDGAVARTGPHQVIL